MNAELPVRHPGAIPPGEAIPSHYDGCFGCGSKHPASLHIQLQAENGVAVSGSVQITPWMQGAPGLAHGGILAAIMDELLGSLNWLVMTPSVTAKLETEFVTPVAVDSTLLLRAWADRRDGRKLYVRGEARLDTAQQPVAVRASGLFVSVPREHFLRYGRAEDVQRARAEGAWNPSTASP